MTSKQPDMNKIAEVLAAADKYPIIMDDLRDLLDTLNDDELKELETSILADGIRDPIVVWKEKDAILDGHNRIAIAKKHDLPFKKVVKSFETIEAAKEWMIRNQLGRRNLSPDRYTYFIGKLYATMQQENPAPVENAEKIAEQFGVSAKTVKRAAEVAKGVDRIAEIRGKIAKDEQLSGKGKYTHDELKQVAKVKSPEIGKRMLDHLDKAKDDEKKAKTAAKKVKASAEKYGLVFSQPDFNGLNYNINTEIKPPLAENAIVYMVAPDEFLGDAMALIKKWGLQYECQFIFYGSDTDSGSYSRIAHTSLIAATKGTVIGPKAGQEPASVQKVQGIVTDAMIKLADANHKDLKKLDFRKGRTADGWDARKA